MARKGLFFQIVTMAIVKRLYHSGYSVAEIAAKAEKSTIRRWLRTAGATPHVHVRRTWT